MRRYIILFFTILIFFTGCVKSETIIEENIDNIDLNNQNIIINFEKNIFAKDSYENCGFTYFIIFESGDYNFEAKGDNNLTWDIYLLDEEWEDVCRFIPQANELSLKTDGTIHIDAGTYVYIQCPINDFTADGPLEGDYLRIYK